MPVVPGRHPLRALAAAGGAVLPLPPKWAEISKIADPVCARQYILAAIAMEWQWTALPADYARVVAASDLLPQSARLVALGGAYVESLQGRCATPTRQWGQWPRPAQLPVLLSRRRGGVASLTLLRCRSAPSGQLLHTELLGEGACCLANNPCALFFYMPLLMPSHAPMPRLRPQRARPRQSSRPTTRCVRRYCASARCLARP